MDNTNPLFYRDLIQPDNSIQQLCDELDEAIAKEEKLRGVIQGAANDRVKAMGAVSGATDEQRQEILKNAEATEALLKAYKEVGEAMLQDKMQKAQLTAASREETQVAKLLVEINNSAEGSYKRLSAQYRLNKIALNEMSAAERENTEYGRKLEAETKAIYEEMNRLQKATGKSQLQVGQYERALSGLVGVNTQYIEVITNSTKRTEFFEGIMKAIKSPIGVAIGLVGGLTAAFKLYMDSVHDTQRTGDAFDYEMAGWRNTWELFKKSVATVDFSIFIRGALDAMNAGKELKRVLDETFERTSSTRLLRASMSAENAALQEAAHNTQLSYEERRAAADKYLENMQAVYDQEEETARRVRDAQIENLFSLTNTRKFATEAEREAAKEEFAANIKNYNLNEETIKQAFKYNQAMNDREIIRKKEMSTTGAASAAYRQQREEMDAVINRAGEDVKAFAGFAKQYSLTNDAQVKAYVDAEVAYQEAQSASYNDQRRMVTLKNNLQAQETQEAERQAKARADAAKRAAEDEAKAAQEAEREKERQAREDENRAKQEIANQRNVLQAQLQSIQLQIQITNEGTQEILALRIAAINKQEEIEKFENAQKAENLRMDEKAIEAKYQKLRLQESAKFAHELAQRDLAALQDYQQAENDLIDQNERQKTLFRLEQEKARLLAILDLDKTATDKMTEQEIAAIKKTIEAIEKEASRVPYKNMYELLGIKLDSEQQSALNTAIDSVKDSIGGIIDSWNQAAQAAVDSANAQVDAAQKVLDAEIEARNAGYANNVAMAQKDLELAKKNQAKAQKEQEKAQKAQIALDSIEQASSLVTASANIWKALSGITGIGPALAVAAIATMWGSFAAAKVKAVQVTKQEQYGEGTVELLQGGSHASGHDIDLGTKRDGTRRRAEGGEFFAVINKRSSRRFRSVIPDVINSLNDGTFADRYQRANAAMAGMAVGMIGGSTDVSGLERDVAAIRKQGDETQYVDGNGTTVIKYKNLTRKIYKN